MDVYIFGNSLIKKDSIPLRLIEVLQKEFPSVNFIHVDPNEDFPPAGEKNLIIIDTVQGIKKVMLIGLDDLQDIKNMPVSPHDYDLLFHLQLLKKLGKINSAKIIGVPQFQYKNLLRQIILIIKKQILSLKELSRQCS